MTFLLGSVYLNFWVSTALKVSCNPSVVMINGVPSHFGPQRTGSAVISALRFRNALVCSSVYLYFSLWLVIIQR